MDSRLFFTSCLSLLGIVSSHRTLPNGSPVGALNIGPVCDPIIYGQPKRADCEHAQDSWLDLISPSNYDFWHNVPSEDTFLNALREYRQDDDDDASPGPSSFVLLPLTVNVGTCTVDVRLEPNAFWDLATWSDVFTVGMGAVGENCLKAYEAVDEPIAGGYIQIGEHNNIRVTFYGQDATIPEDVYTVEVTVPPSPKRRKCGMNAYTFQGTCDGYQENPMNFFGSSVLQIMFGILDVKLWADAAISFLTAVPSS